ncbi:MAG: colicin D domain-containing protein, partial [Neisseria sp.]|nr:colicin D domain-containing protein [Neisseria sp.]
PVGHDFAFKVPPVHINCRTSFTVVLKAPYRGKETAGKRASKDGTVSEGLTYYEWLAMQDKAFQDEVLGKSWGQLFREGGLSAKQFADLRLDRQFKQRTLTDFIDAMPPVKIVTKALPEAMFELSQLRNKFKHAAVFGLNTRQTNFENWQAYRDALVGHLNHSATKQFGIYRNPKKIQSVL